MAKKKRIVQDIVKEEPKIDPINQILPTRHRLKCKNQKQRLFSDLITDKEITLATGPAGVGKSYVAIARAIELLQNTSNQYKKLMIVNPAVEAEEKIGFLPGSLREKLDPFVAPSIDIVDKIITAENRRKLEALDVLVVGGLGFIRGKTIDNTILVMEEAQNMSPSQMKTLLTRIGSNSKFIISGDLDQSDRYSDFRKSGLYDAIKKHSAITQVGVIKFIESEIVRNPLISLILNNYKTGVQPINNSKTIKPISKGVKIKEISKVKVNKRYLVKLKSWFKRNFKW